MIFTGNIPKKFNLILTRKRIAGKSTEFVPAMRFVFCVFPYFFTAAVRALFLAFQFDRIKQEPYRVENNGKDAEMTNAF